MNVNTCLILLFCFLTDIYETLSIVYLAAIISVNGLINHSFPRYHLEPAAPKFPYYINQKLCLVVTPVGNSTQILIMLPAVLILRPTGIKIEGFTQLRLGLKFKKAIWLHLKKISFLPIKCQK